jgi:hypothetical protein
VLPGGGGADAPHGDGLTVMVLAPGCWFWLGSTCSAKGTVDW